MDKYCDRQGCMRLGDEVMKLPDGCEVNVCRGCRPFFHNDPIIMGTYDAGRPGVYWHEHNLF